MINLQPHHRIHVSNKLAILAAVLLLISIVAGVESEQKVYSSSKSETTSVSADVTDNIIESVKSERRGLNLGLLLFRR